MMELIYASVERWLSIIVSHEDGRILECTGHQLCALIKIIFYKVLMLRTLYVYSVFAVN